MGCLLGLLLTLRAPRRRLARGGIGLWLATRDLRTRAAIKYRYCKLGCIGVSKTLKLVPCAHALVERRCWGCRGCRRRCGGGVRTATALCQACQESDQERLARLNAVSAGLCRASLCKTVPGLASWRHVSYLMFRCQGAVCDSYGSCLLCDLMWPW